MSSSGSGNEQPIGDFHAMLHAISTVIADWVSLVTLESRLAGLSVARMLSLAILVGFCLFSVWLLALGAIILVLMSIGYTLVGLLIVAALLNLMMAFLFIFLIHKLSANLLFPATQQSLKRYPKAEEEETRNAAASPTV